MKSIIIESWVLVSWLASFLSILNQIAGTVEGGCTCHDRAQAGSPAYHLPYSCLWNKIPLFFFFEAASQNIFFNGFTITQMYFVKYSCKYRKTSKEARGSYSFSEAQNAGLIRNWAFLPIKLMNYCGSY